MHACRSISHRSATSRARRNPLRQRRDPYTRACGLLAQCVESILAQTIRDIEAIVVVAGSDPARSSSWRAWTTSVSPTSHSRPPGCRPCGRSPKPAEPPPERFGSTRIAAQPRTGNRRRRSDRSGASPFERGSGRVLRRSRRPTSRDRAGRLQPRLSLIADHDLWIRLELSSEVAVAVEPLVGYRDHGGVMTRRIRKLEDELDVIREKVSNRSRSGRTPFATDMFYVWTYRRTFRAGD
jgi:hypothetical protein